MGAFTPLNRETSLKKAQFIIGGIVLVLIIAGAVTAGVLVSKNKSSSSSASSSSSNGSPGISPNSPAATGGTAPGRASPDTGYFAAVRQTNPNDPSTFIRDPNLHDTFYGVAYTPFGSILPSCGANIEAVIEDMQLISQITTVGPSRSFTESHSSSPDSNYSASGSTAPTAMLRPLL
jgi:hypothetical protein